jgi:hypothetical protein
VAAFAAMGVLWGTFAAVLPDLKTSWGMDGGASLASDPAHPLAAVGAMLLAP